jgi:hypothetical protein
MKKYAGILLLLVLAACSNSSNTQETSNVKEVQAKQASGNVQLEDAKTQVIYDEYVALKDALVSSNFDSAKTAALALQEDLLAYEGCENTSLIAKKIAESKDLATQRKEFTYLSSDVIAMFTHATLKKGPIYVQHCPMANKGEGGYWLSSEKKIQNPYYGEEMLECGEVTQEFKSSI